MQVWVIGCGVTMFLVFLISLGTEMRRILSIMISIECLFLSVFFMLSVFLGGFDLVPFLILLVFSVCEAGMMLGVLVRLVRTHGNDCVLSLGVQGC